MSDTAFLGVRDRYGQKDQSFCPKCHRMYCEGYWGEGVCLADMYFGGEPTARGDMIAWYVRQWYELHRETWWQRFWRREECADEFMLAFIGEVRRVEAAAAAERAKKERKE